MAPFLRSPVVAALRPCGAERPKRGGGLFYGEVPAPHDLPYGGRWPEGPERGRPLFRFAAAPSQPLRRQLPPRGSWGRVTMNFLAYISNFLDHVKSDPVL